MGRRPSHPRGSVSGVVALLAGAALAIGCVPPAQGFEDWNAAWKADVSDRTDAVASIEVLDTAGPGAELASDAVRLRNVDPTTIEIAWLGGTCVRSVRFSLARSSGGRVDLRYDIGPPCAVPAPAGYALAIRFRSPIDARSLTALPDWGP